jgi:hypothetical protein
MRVPHRHCPNLVPIAKDWDTPLRKKPTGQLFSTYKVTVHHSQQTDQYDSLADMWTEFYKQYRDADFPRLIIRFEDLLFHRELVMTQIAQCVTGEKSIAPPNESTLTAKSSVSWFHPEQPLKYRLSSVKDHGQSSDLVSAVIKYGTSRGRYAGMATEDLRYATKALDEKLLRTLHYLAVPVV